MNWLTEWKALSAQIEGVLEAARFYLESNRTGKNDSYQVAREQLIPQIKNLIETLNTFSDTHKSFIPLDAAQFLGSQLQKVGPMINRPIVVNDPFAFVHIMGTVLASFRAGFEYYISDTAAVARRLSERAFLHLQRSIIADKDLRRKWSEAFELGETDCEKLGAAHLLVHGIWAFKVNAEGERTDLVFDEPITDWSAVARSAESLVLTEWKCVPSQETIHRIAKDARTQAARYTAGALGGLELTNYKFIVLLSKHHLIPPDDQLDNGITYRHVNISVDPLSPSKKVPKGKR